MTFPGLLNNRGLEARAKLLLWPDSETDSERAGASSTVVQSDMSINIELAKAGRKPQDVKVLGNDVHGDANFALFPKANTDLNKEGNNILNVWLSRSY